MRTDIRWPDQSPVAQLLADIPQKQRARLIRSIVEAALVPGGWAKIVQGQLHIASLPPTPPPAAVSSPVEPVVSPLSPQGARGFVAGLRQFLNEEESS